MIFVDSSVWIDFFKGAANSSTEVLDQILGNETIAVGDLVLAEVLQGFGNERDFNTARKLLSSFEIVIVGGADVAIQAAKNYRRLRAKGVTVRKTIDTIIATRCMVDGHVLLHNDKDFDVFEKHLGLRCLRVKA